MISFYKNTTKRIAAITSALLVLMTQSLMAQTPVANLTCGYTYGNTPAPNWTSILNGSGTTVVASGTSIDDQNYMNNAFPADFTFDFNGTLYTSFNISANGFIFFGNTDPGVITNPIANATTAYEGAIAALGANIQAHNNATNTPQIMVQYAGTAPDRVATIEWSAFKPQGNGGGFCTFLGFSDWNRYDFQIKLYENGGVNSNTIDLIHKSQGPVCIDGNGLSAQVGLRGAANTDFRNRFRNGSTNNTNTSEGTSNTDAISHGAGQYFNADTRMRYTPAIQPAAIEGETEVCVEDGIALAEGNNLPGATYQWYSSPANTPIGGAIAQSYSVSPGLGDYSYYVTVSNASGCLRVSPVYTVSVIACGGGISITSTAGAGGSISPSGTTSYEAGETPTYTFTPDCGYEIASITVNGSPVAIASSYTFSPLASSGSISVTFSLKAEVCNGIDDDCDGNIDNVTDLEVCQICQDGELETLPTLTWYQDLDGDGFGNPSVSISNCIQIVGYVSNSNDCDDTNEDITDVCFIIITSTAGAGGTITPLGATSVEEGGDQTYTITPNCGYEIVDVLVNGSSVGAITTYTFTGVTTNQTISATFSQLLEVCNGIDDDCDGTVDNVLNLEECEVCQEGELMTLPTLTWYQDLDGDGFGNANVSVSECVQPMGYVSDNTDCDDTDEEVGNLCFIIITSTAGTGGTITPLGETVVTEGEDQTYTITANCGFEIVDVLVNGSSVGAITTYTFTEVTTNQTISASFAQMMEVCNGIDDDCDGTIDNVADLTACQICQDGELTNLPTTTWYADLDGDGHGDIDTAIEDCVQPEDYVESNNDCNDEDPLIWLAKPAEIVLDLNPNEACTIDAPFQLGTVEPDNGVWSGVGVNNGIFSPLVAGVGVHTLTYFVPGDGECVLPASASATMTVEVCSNINEELRNSISIYPTYTNGLLTIKGDDLITAAITDMHGKLIETVSLLQMRTIDISRYSSGMYIIRVQHPAGTSILKVIKVD